MDNIQTNTDIHIYVGVFLRMSIHVDDMYTAPYIYIYIYIYIYVYIYMLCVPNI